MIESGLSTAFTHPLAVAGHFILLILGTKEDIMLCPRSLAASGSSLLIILERSTENKALLMNSMDMW